MDSGEYPSGGLPVPTAALVNSRVAWAAASFVIRLKPLFVTNVPVAWIAFALSIYLPSGYIIILVCVYTPSNIGMSAVPDRIPLVSCGFPTYRT